MVSASETLVGEYELLELKIALVNIVGQMFNINVYNLHDILRRKKKVGEVRRTREEFLPPFYFEKIYNHKLIVGGMVGV